MESPKAPVGDRIGIGIGIEGRENIEKWDSHTYMTHPAGHIFYVVTSGS